MDRLDKAEGLELVMDCADVRKRLIIYEVDGDSIIFTLEVRAE
jgi:hypothetical protein